MKQIRLLRENKKMTQKELGKEIGVTLSTISLYESGMREPNIAKLRKLATYFNTTIDELVGKEG